MELQTHTPQHAYNPAWGSSPGIPDNWSASTVAKLYDQDICAWANTNAQLLREKRYDQLDMTNLIEEIEDMARSEQRGILSHLKILLLHLLKWEFQPLLRTNSWSNSIDNARDEIADLLIYSPSLKSLPEQEIGKVFVRARRQAVKETGIPLQQFPKECPYTIEQILNESWLPK